MCHVYVLSIFFSISSNLLSTKLPLILRFAFCMTSFIYPFIVAWTWGGGWLADIFDVGHLEEMELSCGLMVGICQDMLRNRAEIRKMATMVFVAF